MKTTKKILSAISALAMCSTMAFNVSAGSVDLKYDVNGDGVLDRSDLTVLYSYAAIMHPEHGLKPSIELSEELMASVAEKCDYDGNGDITNGDNYVLMIYMLDNGIITADMDMDSAFTPNDGAIVLQYYADTQTKVYTLSEELTAHIAENGDIDGSGSATASDAAHLLQYYRTINSVGDLNSDGAITPVDASNVLSYYSDSQSGIAVASARTINISVSADYNLDGAVTPSDAAEILNYYANKQSVQ